MKPLMTLALLIGSFLLYACSDTDPEKAKKSSLAKADKDTQTATVAKKPEVTNSADVSKPAAPAQTPSTTEKIASQMVIYQEQEKGVEKPFFTRIIVNAQYLRIDEGTDHSSYVLYDREKKIVYSVVHDNATIMTVQSRPVLGKLPNTIKVSVTKSVDNKMPKIGGNQPVHLVQKVNGKACVNYIVVPQTMKGVVKAVSEYRAVLAGQHWLNLNKTPKDMRDPCHSAFDIYQHSGHLKSGLVIREWSARKKRQLIDMKSNMPVSRSLFILPEKYKRYKTAL